MPENLKYKGEARRRQFIERFPGRQRVARRWIAFDEIADWCARSMTATSATAEEEARTLAYDRLDQSVRKGEFETSCKGQAQSRILYLEPSMTWLTKDGRWLRREQLDYGFESIRDQAAQCWLPRELARQWLAWHGYPWPAHFDPMPGSRMDASTGIRTPMSPTVMRARQAVQAPLPGDEVLLLKSGAPLLRGKALDHELNKWALDHWGKDLTKLPSRDELLRLARTKPEFRRITQQDIRRLRARLAPAEIKRGGGTMHRGHRAGESW
jgi:hypothetical protein